MLFLILRWLIRSRAALTRPGLVAGAFAVGYAVFRIFAEFFREPDMQIGFIAGGLTMGMILSLPLLVFGLWIVVRASRLGPRTPTKAGGDAC